VQVAGVVQVARLQQQFDHHPLGAVLGQAAAEILKEAGYGGFDLLA